MTKKYRRVSVPINLTFLKRKGLGSITPSNKMSAKILAGVGPGKRKS